MSRAYRNSSDVPLDAIIKRLHELSDAVVGGRKTQAQEFVMRVPAECDHDADLVLAEAAVRLDALRKYNAELQDENDNLRKANQDCAAWEKACKADLERALARVAELRIQLSDMTGCSCDQENPCKYHAMVTESGRKHVLRKQAEAVEHQVKVERDHFDSYAPCLARMEQRAQRLRQQADQMESTHD